MFPPFPQESARFYCKKLIALIESGEVLLKQVARESSERKNQGLMIGALVCWKKDESVYGGKRVVLFAVSGNSKILELACCDEKSFSSKIGAQYFFVPSIVSGSEIEKALFENDKEIHLLTDKINQLKAAGTNQTDLLNLQKKRTELTDSSLQKVFSLYSFTNYIGKKIRLNEIIKLHGSKLPPTGTGDCCAPKLLSFAFEKGYEIVSMDEVYFGKNTAHKTAGTSYPPCDERCGFILPSILGLEILYRDCDIVVVNKPSGLLSVPGRGEEKADCVENRVHFYFPQAPKQCAVHRLDMETSGLLVLALNKNAHRILNEQFAAGKVHKKYLALLDGILRGKPQGRTELPFRLDVENRPYQIYDEQNGKIGITEWKKLGVEVLKSNCGKDERKVTRVEFSPLTGRTHQLRLASSCPCEKGGLGIPIVGDSLYGNCKNGERLMLHSTEITFYHPSTGNLLHFICKPDF